MSAAVVVEIRLVVYFVGERVDADPDYSFRAAEVPFYFEGMAAVE